MNQTLENFEAEFFLNFDNYDINEESRSKFTKITVSQAIKHLTNLFKNMNFFNLEVIFFLFQLLIYRILT